MATRSRGDDLTQRRTRRSRGRWLRSNSIQKSKPKSRVRSWLDDLNGDDLTQRRTAQSWRRDLEGAISPARLGLGRSLSLSLSLSLGVCESKNDLKVKQKHKSFSGSKALFYGQSYSFSGKLYFTCAPKHTDGCKMNSGNHLHPK